MWGDREKQMERLEVGLFEVHPDGQILLIGRCDEPDVVRDVCDRVLASHRAKIARLEREGGRRPAAVRGDDPEAA